MVWFGMIALNGWSLSPATDNSPTTPTLTRVRLKPVLKGRRTFAKLEPVLLGESSELPTDSSAVATQEKILQAPPTTTVENLSSPTLEARNVPMNVPPVAPQPPADSASPTPKPETNVVQRAATTEPQTRPSNPPEISPAQQLAEARTKLDAGRIREARALLLKLAQDSPKSPEAPEALLLAAGANRDLKQGVKELQAIVETYPNAPATREALARIGELSIVIGDYPTAVKALSAYRLMETDPAKGRQADIQVSLALLRAGQYESARKEYEQLLSRYSDLNQSPQILEGLADARLALGEIEPAASLYEQIDKKFPNYESSVKVMMNRGLCAELRGQTEAAKGFYETIQRDYPKSVEAPLAAARLEDLKQPLIPPMAVP